MFLLPSFHNINRVTRDKNSLTQVLSPETVWSNWLQFGELSFALLKIVLMVSVFFFFNKKESYKMQSLIHRKIKDSIQVFWTTGFYYLICFFFTRNKRAIVATSLWNYAKKILVLMCVYYFVFLLKILLGVQVLI